MARLYLRLRDTALCCGLLTMACTSSDPDAADRGVMELTSPAFAEGRTIPARHTCDGEDVSPALRWRPRPAGTRAFALICDDPDAPGRAWVHWVLYNIPSGDTEVAEEVPPQPVVPSGARQGINDFGRLGYSGPCPPPGGPHRYYFRIYALNHELDLGEGATRADLDRAMEGHVVGEGHLMGQYARQ